MKKTLIIGASTNPSRYAYQAANRLHAGGYDIELVGLRAGEVAGQQIHTDKPDIDDLHTVSLYIGAKHQPEFYKYILDLEPERVIFNPGTENDEFMDVLQDAGIEAQNACTLVMLSVGNY